MGDPSKDHSDQRINSSRYFGLEFGECKTLPHACDVSPNGISLGGLSKTFGLPGLRIGWLASSASPFQDRVRELKDYTTICSASPSEKLACIALRHAESIERGCKEKVEENLQVLSEFTDKWANLIEWRKPQGGTFSMAKVKNLKNEHGGLASRYCVELLKHNVMLLPCNLFGFDKDEYVRLCFGMNNLERRFNRWEETFKYHFNLDSAHLTK